MNQEFFDEAMKRIDSLTDEEIAAFLTEAGIEFTYRKPEDKDETEPT